MNKDMFNHLLDDNEKIIKVFKPNKKIFYLSNVFPAIFLTIFFTIFFSILGLFFKEALNISFTNIPTLGVLAFIGGIVLSFIFIPRAYENTWYGYTNKRLVIRKGIIGIQYQTMELKLVGAIDVKETFINKMFANNTGSIHFSSPSNPMRSDGRYKAFVFQHILNHYEVYKELKTIIDNNKI